MPPRGPTRRPLRLPDFPGAATTAQPRNPEPLAGNYNQCAQLSAVIVKANTNTDNPTTGAVMFHLGTYIPHGVPDTYGFNGIDSSQCTGDTVALTYPSGISAVLGSAVKLRWNGNGVELIGNTGGARRADRPAGRQRPPEARNAPRCLPAGHPNRPTTVNG